MLWSGSDTRQLYRPNFHAHELNAQPNANAIRANPALLMLRLTIELALRDCLRTHEGRPTQEALDAAIWVEARTDWTRRPRPIPPEAIRGEIVFSFEWCCSLLNLDAEDIRQHGLPRLSGFAHNSKQWLPGLPGIREHWARAKEEHEAHIAQAQQHEEEDELLTVLPASV